MKICRTKIWIWIFSGFAVLCIIGLLVQRHLPVHTSLAEIWLDGEPYQTVSLTEDRTFVIETEHGSNTVEIHNGTISVTAASCPDKICVRHGAAKVGDPIVCLPNCLVIRLTDGDSSAADAYVG